MRLRSGDNSQDVECGERGWSGADGELGSDVVAAERVRVRFGLDTEIPHDSRNILVDSAFGLGAITSRGHSPEWWEYFHGKHLVPETSAACTLNTRESVHSLELAIAGCLARVRVLATQGAKPPIWGGSPLPASLALDAPGFGTVPWIEHFTAELLVRIHGVSSPFDEMFRAVHALKRLGHHFECWDEDGGSSQHWFSPHLELSLSCPDLSEISAGDLPDWEPEEGVLSHAPVRIRRYFAIFFAIASSCSRSLRLGSSVTRSRRSRRIWPT